MRVGLGSCCALLWALLSLAACGSGEAVRGPDAAPVLDADAGTLRCVRGRRRKGLAAIAPSRSDSFPELAPDAGGMCRGGAGCPCLSPGQCDDGDPWASTAKTA